MSDMVQGHGHRQSGGASAFTTSQESRALYHHNTQSHASNSQVAMDSPYRPSTPPPKTPRRDNRTPAPQKQALSGAETGSKQKPRRKPKNGVTSPGANKKDRDTPPLKGIASSTKAISTPTAYAGPTYHASPAPSALPIPSFYSKSVPESPGIKSLRDSNDTPVTDSPTTSPMPAKADFQREESPLDLFFKADREQKARVRSAGSNQANMAGDGPFQPPSGSPHPVRTPASTGPNRSHRISSSGMFAMELDGESNPGSPYGPAFSTPYSERINAARSDNANGQPPRGGEPTMSSEALKAYLFSGVPLTSPSVTSPGSGHTNSASTLHSAPHLNQRSGFSPAASRNGSNSRQQSDPLYPLDMRNTNYATKASIRSSGLRQEVTPTKTPTETFDTTNNYASPTPSRSNGNSSSSAHGYNQTLASRTAAPPPAFGLPAGGPGSDLKGMEDSLRRILKLDSPAMVASASGIGGLPAASASVPNYVGGRSPPNFGTHNGVMGS